MGCIRILEKVTRGVNFSKKVQEKRFVYVWVFKKFLLTEKCLFGVKFAKKMLWERFCLNSNKGCLFRTTNHWIQIKPQAFDKLLILFVEIC